MTRSTIIALLVSLAAYGQTQLDIRTQGRNFDFSQAGYTRPFKVTASLPATCVVGDTVFLTTAAPGTNIYSCVETDTWAQQAGGSGAGGGTANYVQSFTTATSITLTHNSGSIGVLAQCFDGSGYVVEFNSFQVLDDNSVRVTFTDPQTGYCVVNSAAAGGGGGGGQATSASNIGVGGVGPFKYKIGSDLQFKNIAAAGNRIQVTDNTSANQIDLDINQPNLDLSAIGGSLGSAQISSGSKQGNGSKIAMFAGTAPVSGNCTRFDASGNVTDAGAPCGTGGGGSGEANTASNAGTGGVGLFKQKSGVDLQFKNIYAASNRIQVTDNTGSSRIDLDITQANLDLSAIGGSISAAQIASSAKQGNGSKVALFAGSAPVSGNCTKFDANGNVADAGAPCGTGGSSLPTQSGSAGKFLTTNGSSASWNDITQLQGVTVASTAPANGQALVFNSSAARWEPGTISASGTLLAGPGIIITGGNTVAVDTAAVPAFLTGVLTNYDFASISAYSCKTAQFTVTGASPYDAVASGWPVDLESGLTGVMLVTASNEVTVRLCNVTGSSVDPGSHNYKVTILRSF